MDNLLGTLLDMGFNRIRVEKALKATSGKNLDEAMDWLMAHEDDPNVDVPLPKTDNVAPSSLMEESSIEIVFDSTANSNQTATSTSTPEAPKPAAEPTLEAHSFKCEECGKLFKNEDEVQFHAAKSNHTQFSESTEVVKALTEEERKERLQSLQYRLKAKREQNEAELKRQAIELEKSRRKMGQEMLASKQRIEEEEMKKIVEDRKRQKRDDILARQKILEQIKIDREDAKKQQEKDKQPTTNTSPLKLPEYTAPAASSDSSKQYDETRIQIRLLNGNVLTQTFKAKEQLSAVRLFIELNGHIDVVVPFTLMTNFPKKVFDDEDMEKPLKELGLVPSAVLIMVRKV